MQQNINTTDLMTLSRNLDIINANVELGSAKAVNILDYLTLNISEVVPEDIPNRLSGFNKKFNELSSIIENHHTYANYLKNTNLSGLKNIKEKDAKIIRNKIVLLSLKIKKTDTWIQLELTKLKRSLLVLATDIKLAPLLATLFAPIILAIQIIFTAVMAIIAILDKILLLIPFMFSLAAEGMAFFLTPKSFKSTSMTILNANSSVTRIYPAAVVTMVNEILNAPLYTMAANKQAAMVASISASAANNNIIAVDADISYTARDILLKAVNIILAVLPIVEPLPKYERLPMYKNLGFFLWLLTGWCPAGKKSFGLPGMP